MLYHTAMDKDAPASAKALILGALGYFIPPIDTIPDVTPVIGFSDDLAVLTATILKVVASIKEEHKQKAKEQMKKWC